MSQGVEYKEYAECLMVSARDEEREQLIDMFAEYKKRLKEIEVENESHNIRSDGDAKGVAVTQGSGQ